jgi:Ca2+-binding EF-hand superfamily protein
MHCHRRAATPATLLAALSIALATMPSGAFADAIADLFNEFDANRDGGITLEEFTQHRAERFKKYDSNADEQISIEEFTAGVAADKLDSRKQRFHEMDTNGDGMLTESDMTDRANAQFAGMDTNGDGKVDLAEFTAAVHPAPDGSTAQ